MKIIPFSMTAGVIALLAACSTSRPGAPAAGLASVDQGVSSNSFDIFLIAESADVRLPVANLSEVKLISPPVISEADIISVDLAQGAIKLRPSAFTRLPELSVQGTRFVTVVNGERLFVGAFSTLLSSYGPAANATIGLDRAARQDYLMLGWYDPLRLRGGYGWWSGKEAEGDLWSDPRLKACLQKLRKLGHIELL